MIYQVLATLFFAFSCMFGMYHNNSYIELFPNRISYAQQNTLLQQNAHEVKKEGTTCIFCSDKLDGIVLTEDGIQVFLNKFPYLVPSVGDHLLITPKDHKEKIEHFLCNDISCQAKVLRKLVARLSNNAYYQEIFVNEEGNKSIAHWHWHLKNMRQPKRSLPQLVAFINENKGTSDEVFERVKAQLQVNSLTVSQEIKASDEMICQCELCALPCCDKYPEDSVTGNAVIGHFNHNFVCIAHYPVAPGHLCIIPYKHHYSVGNLSRDVFAENMSLAMQLLLIVQKYGENHIYNKDYSGNIYIKNLGGKLPLEEREAYHVYTDVIPRIGATFVTPGLLKGDSVALPIGISHFFDYMRKECAVLKASLEESAQMRLS